MKTDGVHLNGPLEMCYFWRSQPRRRYGDTLGNAHFAQTASTPPARKRKHRRRAAWRAQAGCSAFPRVGKRFCASFPEANISVCDTCSPRLHFPAPSPWKIKANKILLMHKIRLGKAHSRTWWHSINWWLLNSRLFVPAAALLD